MSQSKAFFHAKFKKVNAYAEILKTMQKFCIKSTVNRNTLQPFHPTDQPIPIFFKPTYEIPLPGVQNL